MNSERADSFLRLIRKSQRGKLKIYLGYCAGVGKTYLMLQEGHRLVSDGMDCVVGYVETHGRKDTIALAENLESIPRRSIEYRGIRLEEMDVDAIIERRPFIVLVDELAHTNVPGSRHAKRYQDVEDILAAGIHVISTLNVQHLESLYDTVEKATRVRVKERIPDKIVVEADQLVNVDLTTEDLRKRLLDGKIYSQDKVPTAMTNFFTTENLEQLRELALRELASQIDTKRREPSEERITSNPEQIMVCLSSRGPNSEKMLRFTSRLAGRLNRNWYAVYVQTSSENPLRIDAETQRILSNTLTLAGELGATVFTYKGDDVASTIIQFAREYRVGFVVTGSPGKKIPFYRKLLGETSIVDKLIERGSGLNVMVLDTREADQERMPASDLGEDEDKRVDLGESSEVRSSALKLSNIHVVFWERPVEKEKALRQLLEECCEGENNIDKEAAWNGLVAREMQGSTFFGDDVALPHTRLTGLTSPVLGIGIAHEGVFEKETQKTVRILFMLLTSTVSPEIQINLLGQVSRLAINDTFREALLSSKGTNDVIELLKDYGIAP